MKKAQGGLVASSRLFAFCKTLKKDFKRLKNRLWLCKGWAWAHLAA
jgi:hypothetical protein